MIDIQVKIHDKFSIEFKVGYVVKRKQEPNDFALNMWIFVPNSLDISAETYSKGQFYRDIKTNVRLITPVFLLRDIAGGQAIPLKNLENSFSNLASDPSKANSAEYEYQIKMFMAIFKSSIRDEVLHIMSAQQMTDMEFLCGEFVGNVGNITKKYRDLRHLINVHTIPEEIRNLFFFGDEFMSSTIEKQVYRLIRSLDKQGKKEADVRASLLEMVRAETGYRHQAGYLVVETDSADNNRGMIYRQSVLKKYIESDLFLMAKTKRDGVAMEQIYLSIAAGVAMIFATAIAFAFQIRYGSLTMPLFVALVVSYMLKDRIKDLMRYFFAHRLKDKYFDNKTTIAIKERPLGWIKEGMDFITDEKVPPEVMEIRSRSPLLQAEGRINDEKIILYRKRINIDSQALQNDDKYFVIGINDIARLYINSFTQRLDNPEVPLFTSDDEGDVVEVLGSKIYYLNFIIQLKHEEQLEYKRYRLVFNRAGILEIEELK